jgi:hypothetical protein
VLHTLDEAHDLASCVNTFIVVGCESVWQSASDTTSILPLLHSLRVADDAAVRLLAFDRLGDALNMFALPDGSPLATMEQLWTSHRALQWFNSQALKSTLQLVGVKPARAEAAVAWIFSVIRSFARAGALRLVTFEADDTSFILSRAKFSTLVRWALCKCGFERVRNLIDFDISSNVRDGQCCVIILLGGTSGTGKSTLAALLSSKLGISTVLSTDFVRHLLRKVMSRESHPVLWGSTYNAAECMSPAALDPHDMTEEARTARVISGYLEQSSLIHEQLFSVIMSYVSAKRSLIVEGVHLTPALMYTHIFFHLQQPLHRILFYNFFMAFTPLFYRCQLSAACPSCIPFVIYIRF